MRKQRAEEGGGGGSATRNASGTLLEVPAGGAVVFSSRLWHCSGPNGTDRARRVFYAQFSEEPITDGAMMLSLTAR